MLHVSELKFEIKNHLWFAPCVTLKPGTVTVLLGPNGSGKSVFLEVLLQIFPNKSGRVTIENQSSSDWLGNIGNRRKLGVALSQSFYPEHIKIFQWIILHKSIYFHQEKRLIDLFGIPEIYDKVYTQLSEGQKQRFHLFMALAHNPGIVLLDEATRGLDANYLVKFIDLIARIRSEKTLLLISHCAEELELADSIVWIENNRYYQSTPEDYLSNLGRLCYEIPIKFIASFYEQFIKNLKGHHQITKIVLRNSKSVLIFSHDELLGTKIFDRFNQEHNIVSRPIIREDIFTVIASEEL